MIRRQKIATTFKCSITALLTNRIVHQVLYVLICFRCQRCDKDLNANHDSFVFLKTLFALHHCIAITNIVCPFKITILGVTCKSACRGVTAMQPLMCMTIGYMPNRNLSQKVCEAEV